MNKALLIVKNIVIRAFSLFQTFVLVKVCAWAILVAAPYMEATQLDMRCSRFLANNNLNNFAKYHKLTQTAAICPIDEQSCEKAKEAWTSYEKKHKRYSSYRWLGE